MKNKIIYLLLMVTALFSMDDFVGSTINQSNLKNLTTLGNTDSVQNFSKLAGIDGMNNLDFINKLGSTDFSNFSLSNLGSLNDFKFDIGALNSFDNIKSLTSSMGLSGKAKGSLQNLIAMESQLVTQDSGQTINQASSIAIYREELLLWKQLNFLQTLIVEIDSR